MNAQVAAPGALAPDPAAMKRIKLGAAVFVGGWLVGLGCLPFVNGSDLSSGMKATLTTVCVLIVPKVFLVVAVAIMGKPGFAYLKSIVFGHFKKYAPPAEVSHARYRTGLVLLVGVIVLSSLGPYVGDILPGQDEHQGLYGALGDLLLLLCVFILGGDFWDKLRALFYRDAKAVFPNK